MGDLKQASTEGIKTVAVSWGYQDEKILAKESSNFILTRPQDTGSLIPKLMLY